MGRQVVGAPLLMGDNEEEVVTLEASGLILALFWLLVILGVESTQTLFTTVGSWSNGSRERQLVDCEACSRLVCRACREASRLDLESRVTTRRQPPFMSRMVAS